jgi:hypothetical protein
LATNSLLATAKNPLANVTAPVVKQFILIDPTNALITAQIPVSQPILVPLFASSCYADWSVLFFLPLVFPHADSLSWPQKPEHFHQ